MLAPQVSFLADGQRLHLHHGPIDLIIDVNGPGRDAGLHRAIDRFETVLSELAGELSALRRPVSEPHVFKGRIAIAMQRAAQAYLPAFVTPMAAVAGAVADEILTQICAGEGITRAYVNNGGDIAFCLTQGETFVAALPNAQLTLSPEMPVRGVATSGWRGRSHSLGIADNVTVIAKTAAQADVAATLIANAVDIPDHREIERVPAQELAPDSDLGQRRVTIGVSNLSIDDMEQALDAGQTYAETCRNRGLIEGACLQLGPMQRFVGMLPRVTKSEKDRIHA